MTRSVETKPPPGPERLAGVTATVVRREVGLGTGTPQSSGTLRVLDAACAGADSPAQTVKPPLCAAPVFPGPDPQPPQGRGRAPNKSREPWMRGGSTVGSGGEEAGSPAQHLLVSILQVTPSLRLRRRGWRAADLSSTSPSVRAPAGCGGACGAHGALWAAQVSRVYGGSRVPA